MRSLQVAGLVVQHLGELHSYERALVLLVAFGPFVVLAVVVYVLRRRDLAAEARDREARGDSIDGSVDGRTDRL
jgi:hypothetical protein